MLADTAPCVQVTDLFHVQLARQSRRKVRCDPLLTLQCKPFVTHCLQVTKASNPELAALEKAIVKEESQVVLSHALSTGDNCFTYTCAQVAKASHEQLAALEKAIAGEESEVVLSIP